MSGFIYAIRDGEGYWFSRFDDNGDAFFVSRRKKTKRYRNAAKAIAERDGLAQLLNDDSLTVRQIAPAGTSAAK
jgi:hypothetical protein